MSSAPEIEVAVETPEHVMFDLQRMVDLDFTHGQQHKAENNPDSCHICHKVRNQIKFYAEVKTQLSTVGELVERTAKTLSKQEAGVKWSVVGYDHDDFYWTGARSTQERNAYRRRAVELVYDLFGSELRIWGR
jgi:hypothetical protein